MKMSSITKFAAVGVLTAGMAIAPFASAEAREWDGNRGNNHHNSRYDRGHDNRHDNRNSKSISNGNALLLGLLGGALIASLTTSSHDHVVVHQAPRPVYHPPRYRTAYVYPTPVYGRYAYRY
jgi:hypothetical protein